MSAEVVSRKLNSHRGQRSRNTGSLQKPQGPAIASSRLHVICVVMSLLAAFIFTLTEHDDHEHTLWCAFEIGLQTLIVVMATAYFRRRIAVLHESPVIMPMLVMIASLSLICEPIQRLLFGTGHAFEILVMHCSCNLMLALAVCGFRMPFQRLAALIAVFMTIFCCTISSAPGLIPLVVLFTVAAIVWLVAAWWDTVDRRMLETERSGMPLRWLAAGVVVPVLIVVAADGFGANSVTTALRGFMPSSGGTGDYSPFSRGGVNDGDALVAGDQNIKSFAPLEDAPFLDSEKPSLYDVFNDTFDEPTKRKKSIERAIPLTAELLKHIHQLMAEAKQAGREFSLRRTEQKSDSKRIRDLDTVAMFYIAGRTPLHLRMEVYELFDGTSWMAGPREPMAQVPTLKQTGDRDWLSIPQRGRSLEIFSGTATHSIKVANLEGNVIPVPAHPAGVSIPQVNRADMYRIDEAELISLDRKTIPSMTPISIVSHCVDWPTVTHSTNTSLIRSTNVRSLSDINLIVPEGADMDEIRQLATDWTAGVPSGWSQVEAITNQLRNNYVLDRDSRASLETESPIHEFLFETRRGPEYLFASSAAVMLRSLGYPARVVSGFYARPERYDDHKKHTAVEASDAHFWCEVYVGSGTWLTVEASPGYGVLGPPPGILEGLQSLVVAVWESAVEHSALLVAVTILAAGAFVGRRSLQNALLTLRWRLTARRSLQRKAVHLAVLIDHRLRLTGLERRAGTTLSRWARQQVLEPVRRQLVRVAEIADQAVFRGDVLGHVDVAELNELALTLSYRRLRGLSSESPLSRSATTNGLKI